MNIIIRIKKIEQKKEYRERNKEILKQKAKERYIRMREAKK